jgi:hypothetical protein
MAKIVLVSGASGIGKDYVIDNIKGSTKTLQMTTERPSRGESESKICISSSEYKQLQEANLLIGDHRNDTGYQYAYNIGDIQNLINNETIIMEVNPADQADLYHELSERNIEVRKWIGFTANPDYITVNMILRKAKINGGDVMIEPTIPELTNILNEQGFNLSPREGMTFVDIAKQIGLIDIDDRLRMAERLNAAIQENENIEEISVGWSNRAEIVEEVQQEYGDLFKETTSNPECL